MLRRVLLVLALGLIVARPLVGGEDPGLQADATDAGGLLLSLLWLVVAAGWGVWRLVSGKASWHGGLVDLGLFLAAAAYFLSAFQAGYAHPARLVAWEWLVLFVGLVLVRQLIADDVEHRRVVAVLLAGAVALAAQAVFQAGVTLPEQRDRYPDAAAWNEDHGLPRDDPAGTAEWQHLRDARPTATYQYPDSLAAVLVLALPALVVAGFVSSRSGATREQTTAVFGCAAVVALALALSGSRAALLAVGLAGLGAFACWRRRVLWRRRVAVLLTAAVLGTAGYGLAELGLLRQLQQAGPRPEYWRASWQLVEQHPWLGVGGGNYRDAVRALLPPEVGEPPREAFNLVLDTWTGAGLLAPLGVLLALGAFFVALGRNPTPQPSPLKGEGGPELTTQGQGPPEGEVVPFIPGPTPTGMAPVRWEFYLAGMQGLLLGFLLRAGFNLDSVNLDVESFATAVRVAAWFFAYFVLERVTWDRRTRALALAVGVAATVLTLLLAGGIAFPSVAGPLWVAVGVALLGVGGRPWPEPRWQRVAQAAPLPVLLALGAWFVLTVFSPVVTATNLERKALLDARNVPPRAPQGTPDLRPAFIQANVLQPLEQATRADPSDAHAHALVAEWYLRLYGLVIVGEESLKRAVAHAVEAQPLGPPGPAGFLAEYDLRMAFGRNRIPPVTPAERLALGGAALVARSARWQTLLELPASFPDNKILLLRDEAREQFDLAARALERYAPSDPSNARLHGDWAEALYESGQAAAARDQAGIALDLDRRTPPSPRSLTDRQRAYLTALQAGGPGP